MCKTKRIIIRIIKYSSKYGITASAITTELGRQQTYSPTTREVQNHLDDLESDGLVQSNKSYYTGWTFYKLRQGDVMAAVLE